MSGKCYHLEAVDPSSGQLRTIMFYRNISLAEIKELFQASFGIEAPIVGLTDESSVMYPLAMLAVKPKMFHTNTYSLIYGTLSSGPVSSLHREYKLTPQNSEETLFSMEKAEEAFNALDLNGDGYVHKEEFIEKLTRCFSHLLTRDPRFSFAYSCITAKELAVATAVQCYELAEESDTYYMELDDFAAFYLSPVENLSRDMLILALDAYAGAAAADQDENGSPSMRRSKSQTTLNIGSVYSEDDLIEFIASCKFHLKIDKANISHIVEQLKIENNGRPVIQRSNFFSILIKCLENFAGHEASDSEDHRLLVSVLDILFLILKPNQNDSVKINQVASLLTIISDGYYLDNYKSIFNSLPGSESGFVPECILQDHLTVVLRLIFYFSSNLHELIGCAPEHLAHAIATKFLGVIDVKRQHSRKLSFKEFIELFVHALKLAVDMLQMQEGYFVRTLTQLVGYQSSLVRGGRQGTSAVSSPLSTSNVKEHDAATRHRAEAESETSSITSGRRRAAAAVLGEPDIVSAEFVSYFGDAVAVDEARNVLSLDIYDPEDVILFLRKLADDGGYLDLLSYQQGILKLIGDKYVTLNVFERSIADFIVDRIFQMFDPLSDGYCHIRELGCAILLFCGGSPRRRAAAAFQLLQSLPLDSFAEDNISPDHVHISVATLCVTCLLKAHASLDPKSTVEPENTRESDSPHHSAGSEESSGPEGDSDKSSDTPEQEQYSSTAIAQVLSFINHLKKRHRREATEVEQTHFMTAGEFVRLLAKTIVKLMNTSRPLRSHFSRSLKENVRDSFSTFASDAISESGTDASSVCGARIAPMDYDSGADMTVVTVDDEDGENDKGTFEGDTDFLDDNKYPPSAVVLELRAARSVLGLDSYAADDMLESLGKLTQYGGILRRDSWIEWVRRRLRTSCRESGEAINEEDYELALLLAESLFDEFDDAQSDQISFCELVAGLSFLCGGSPMEDKIMVSFTVVDKDSDGYITPAEWRQLVFSTLRVIATCSRLGTDRVLRLCSSINGKHGSSASNGSSAVNCTLADLAAAAAEEGLSAMHVDEEDHMSLEMLLEIAEDYLKLAAVF